MRTLSLPLVVLLGVTLAGPAAAELTIVEEGIDLAPAPQPEQRPVGYVWKTFKNGQPHERRLIERTGDTETLEASDGCRWTRLARTMSPSLSWQDCDGRSGSARVTFKGGQVYPMKVGNTWSYTHNGDSWSTDRDCEVEDAVRVRVDLGEYDTFKVVCIDRWNTRTMYYAPSLEKSVFSERFRRARLERDQWEIASEQ